MRIPYGFTLTSSGTLEINRSEANVVRMILISIWQEQVWERSWICFMQNKYLLRPEKQNGLELR